MVSTLETCADTASRPASPSTGQTVYQEDTNQIIVWDGSVWQVYDSDRLQYSTSNELHYSGNAMSFTTTDGSVPYYCPQPQVHFNSTYVAGTGTNPDNGRTVSTWTDISGNSNDAGQTQALYQPIYYKDNANRGFLSFDRNEFFSLTSNITISGDFTQIFVGQRMAQVSSLTSAGGSGYYLIHVRNPNLVYLPLTTSNNTETASGTSPYFTNEMWTIQRGTVGGTANTVTLAVAGGNVSSNHTFVNTDTKTMTWVGKSGSFGHDGQYYEMLHWNSQLDADELNRVRLYLTNKYGLTTTAFS